MTEVRWHLKFLKATGDRRSRSFTEKIHTERGQKQPARLK
jgi:hypothetical protein